MTALESFLQPELLIPASIVLGLAIGSFLNVVIHRLPQMMEHEWQAQCAELRDEPLPIQEPLSLAKPRSRCAQCGQQIRAVDNIPIVSWLLLRGKCRQCGTRISVRYPIVEALTGAASGLCAWHFGASIATIGAMLFVWAMIALTFIDFDTQLLPDSITLPIVWLGLLFNLAHTYTDLPSAVIGAVAGYMFLWSIYWVFKLLTQKEGMGYGDFKLLAAIGAWFGWQMLPLAILASSAVGAVVGISLILLTKHGRNVPIPFGPYLAAAGILVLFFGRQLTQLYLGIM